MRYRNISLNDNKGRMYYLIKYSDEFKSKEKEMKNFDEWLVKEVLGRPSSLSELSEEQGYMLLDESSELLGLVKIGTSCDEKDLELELEFSDEKLPFLENKLEVFYTLLDKLELFFYDKNNIEIQIHNGINLSVCNPLRFKRMPYSEDYVTYRCKNTKKELISRLIEEIRYASGDNSTLGKRNESKIEYGAIDFGVDQKLMEEVENGNVPLTEVFNKITSLEWIDKVDLSTNRKVAASRKGNMTVTEETRYIGSNPESKYTIKYGVLRPGFTLEGELFQDNEYSDVEIEDNKFYTRVSYDGFTYIKNKESKTTEITYQGPVIGGTSVSFQGYGENNEINRLNVDIRTHKKSTGKTNGTYSLRVNPMYNFTDFRHYSRKGNRSVNYDTLLMTLHPTEFENIAESGFTGENTQNLIAATIDSINNDITHFGKVHPIEVPNFEEKYKKVVSTVQALQERTPLPYLQEQLSQFTNTDTKKEKTTIPQLKKKF